MVRVSHCVRLHPRVPQEQRQLKTADFLSRLPESVTDHDHSESSSLALVEDGGIFLLIRPCGLSTRSSPTPGVGLSVLVPRPESAVLGGLLFTSSNFRDFRAHGPRMRIDDVFAP